MIDLDRKKVIWMAEVKDKSISMLIPNLASILTPDGRRIDTNLAAEEYFRRSRDETIGERIEALYVKEDAERIKEMHLKNQRDRGFLHGVTAKWGDGTTFPAVLNFVPIKDEKGGVINVLGTASNV